MPLFYTPKPRQFSYKPRFYDPEKERWEALKQKYADEQKIKQWLDESTDATVSGPCDDKDLEYFQRRVRELDSDERKDKRSLTWKDLFRKREMPKFNYQPRFSEGGLNADNNAVTSNRGSRQGVGEHIAEFKKRGIKIKRRFDVTDPDYMKPVPATRIMLYALLVCMLLYWIIM